MCTYKSDKNGGHHSEDDPDQAQYDGAVVGGQAAGVGDGGRGVGHHHGNAGQTLEDGEHLGDQQGLATAGS